MKRVVMNNIKRSGHFTKEDIKKTSKSTFLVTRYFSIMKIYFSLEFHPVSYARSKVQDFLSVTLRKLSLISIF